MVVVVIIGLLAGAVALKVGGYLETAETERVHSDLASIRQAVELYNTQHRRYPSNDQGLGVLDLETTTDPWGNPYYYNSPPANAPEGYEYEIYTLGADGQPGGEGKDADIYSWQMGQEDQGNQP